MKQKCFKPQLKTPITYYGGKQYMLRYILPLIPEHKIYSESFFGGGALFWAKEPSKIEFINDINGDVVNFYRVLKLHFPELKAEIEATLHSEFQQKLAKEIYHNPKAHDEIKRAWAFYVLSHQSFYGLMDNTWAFSKRRSMALSIQALNTLITDTYVKRLSSTSILCRDALKVIKSTDSQDTFHYIDPPYYQSNMGHYDGYTLDDFENLLKVLSTLKGNFILSSYPSSILSEYSAHEGWKILEFEMPRVVGGGRKVEVLTLNYDVGEASTMAA